MRSAHCTRAHGAWALALWLCACSAIPAPRVLAEIDSVRESRSALAAKRDAPVAFAVAERLRDQALAALDRDDTATAQVLGEQALAAYEEAVALARVVRADKARARAEAEAAKLEKRLAELDRAHQEIGADIAAVEQRLKVIKSTEPIDPSGVAGPQLEQARWQAVASLHLGARLLCSAARMLADDKKAKGSFTEPPEVAEAAQALAELDAAVAAKPAAAPIDAAMRARARCLKGLTLVRRAGSSPDKAAGAGDALLEALSKSGKGVPSRDDRGVVVTLRGLFVKGELSASGKQQLEDIAQLGANHGAIPVMVVLHQSAAVDDAQQASWLALGGKVVGVLRQHLGDGRVRDAHVAGNAAPMVDPAGKHAAQNERVEIIFVTPETL
jgi:hypothetical protein